MLGFQKGWDSVKKHIKAIRSPCFFSATTTGVNTPHCALAVPPGWSRVL